MCADAEEMLGENDRSNFLTAHSKVTHRLEECFVELLMLDESDICNLTLAGVESLEKKIELFHFEEHLTPLDTGTNCVCLIRVFYIVCIIVRVFNFIDSPTTKA